MKRLSIGLLATVIVGVGFVGPAQAHSPDRDGEWRGEHAYPAQRAHRHRDSAHGGGRFQRYVDQRQDRQQYRIREGWRSGELTRKELNRLRKEQRRIANLERKFAADGDWSRRERRALRETLDDASARIHRKKHNDRSRFASHHDRAGKARAEAFGAWSDGLGFVWYELDSRERSY